MNVVVCDAGDCVEPAIYSVKILEGDFEGMEFDVCSVEHITAYVTEIKEVIPVP